MNRLRIALSTGSIAALFTVGMGTGGLAAVSQAASPHREVLGIPANFAFQTIDNPADTTFNQLLGINDSYLIAGYYGSGTSPTHPNKGYVLRWPYAPADYTKENHPGSRQTQVTGLNNGGDTVGFYADANVDNFGFTDVGGHFAKVIDPHTPKSKSGAPAVNQLLGVNSHRVAVGFYNDAKGNAHGYTYNVAKHSFRVVTPPGATSVTASGINDDGDVCGFLTKKNGDVASFLDKGGKFTTFEFPGSTDTTALGLNNSNVVVGSYVDAGNLTHGFVDDGGHFQTVDDPKEPLVPPL